MKPERLEFLLQQADATAPQPRLNNDVATRVLTCANKRRRRRITILGLGVVVGAATLTTWMSHGRHARSGREIASANDAGAERSSTDVGSLRQEIDCLRREADLRLALVVAQARHTGRNRETPVDPIVTLRAQVDCTASALVEQADRLYRERGLREAAASRYRSVLEDFPASDAALAARQRLNEIERGVDATKG